MGRYLLRLLALLSGLGAPLWLNGAIDSGSHVFAAETHSAISDSAVLQAPTNAYGLSDRALRSDEFDIVLLPPESGPARSEIEYKVHLRKGDVLLYSWRVEGLSDPEEFYFDFHGERPSGPQTPGEIEQSYDRQTGLQPDGYLIAPFSGVHGWYFQNQSATRVVIRLKLTGFYELIPPGEFGNEGRVLPNR